MTDVPEPEVLREDPLGVLRRNGQAMARPDSVWCHFLHGPIRLWSPWDMLKIDMGTIVQAIAITSMIEQVMRDAEKGTHIEWEPKALVRPELSFVANLRKLRECVLAIGVPFTLLSIDRALARIDRGECDAEELLRRIELIHGRLKDELDAVCVYYVPADSAKYLTDRSPPFGEEVSRAFPSASYDIDEAGKCLGLRRSTACVTHLMRALEVALRVISTPFGVDTAHTNWHNIIDQVEAKIKSINAGSHGPDWKEQQHFFAAGAVHFRMLKDGWRNHAMHVREKYTEEQAEDIYRSTRSFMRHLSQRLSE